MAVNVPKPGWRHPARKLAGRPTGGGGYFSEHVGSAGLILRVFRLWRLYAYLDLLWMTRSLRQSLGYSLVDVVMNISAVTGTFLLAERFAGIGAWSKPQVVFMLGYAILATALLDALFGYNVAFISRRVGRGQFDHTLVQPYPVWVVLLTEGFAPFSALASLFPGPGLMLWGLSQLPSLVSPTWLALLCLNIISSATIVLAFSYVWGSLAFWAPRAAEEISSSSLGMLNQLKPFPLDGAGLPLLGGLLTLVPAGFVAWYPCRALLGIDQTAYGFAITPVAAGAMAALAAWVFHKGLKHYGRTGSQRYSTFGHRR